MCRSVVSETFDIFSCHCMCTTPAVQWHFIPNVKHRPRVNVCTPGDRFGLTYNMSSEQHAGGRALTLSCRASVSNHTVRFYSNLLVKHACDDVTVSVCDDDNDGKMMMTMTMPSGERGLTLGTESIRAVLGGLAVPFAHLASVSGCWRVASSTALALTLAAAHGPFAPLVPASINCSTWVRTNVHREININTRQAPFTFHQQAQLSFPLWKWRVNVSKSQLVKISFWNIHKTILAHYIFLHFNLSKLICRL